MLFQEKLIKDVTKACQIDCSIASAMMYGSFTKGEGDEHSDVEFYILINNDRFKTFNSNDWIVNLYATDLIYYNEQGTLVAIFSNLVRGEFHFLPQSEMNIIKAFKQTGSFPKAEQMFIYDETDQLYDFLEELSGEGPNWKTNDHVNFAFHNFVNQWIFGVNVLKRGEYARSLEILSHVQQDVLKLLRIHENSVERWINATKNLEHDLSERSYENYKQTTASLNRESLVSAYNHALRLAKRLHFDLLRSYDVHLHQDTLMKMHAHLGE
ncbi:lincosamide nucleotidyltransferase [Bacillaceae bacterium JMAK1]|nr:lincosamide nucleotidyltransferase [Bacillaceae bacterium JMAK1]